MSDMTPQPNAASSSGSFSPPPPPAPVIEQPAPRPLHLRKPAIVLFVIGLLILMGGITGFIAGGLQTWGAVCFWGVLLFAFSFIPLPKAGADAPAPMSAFERIA